MNDKYNLRLGQRIDGLFRRALTLTSPALDRYELLHPRPGWVTEALRNRSATADDSDSISEGAGGERGARARRNEDGDSSQVLARLLKDVDLSRSPRRRQDGSVRLKAEVINIQRMKDVGGAQPVG